MRQKIISPNQWGFSAMDGSGKRDTRRDIPPSICRASE